MTTTPSLRIRRMIVSGLALLSLLITAQVIAPKEAQARCVGVNQPVTSTLGASAAFVTERPAAGTCNNNNTYAGTIQALNRPDVIFISVYIQNNGVWRQVQYTNIKTRPVEFAFSDTNSNSWMTLCWYEESSNPRGIAHCGWGSEQGPTGTSPASRPDIYNQARYHGVVSGF